MLPSLLSAQFFQCLMRDECMHSLAPRRMLRLLPTPRCARGNCASNSSHSGGLKVENITAHAKSPPACTLPLSQAAASVFLGPDMDASLGPETPEPSPPAAGGSTAPADRDGRRQQGVQQNSGDAASPESRKKAAKAFARLGAAREATGERLASVRAFWRAYELDGSAERCGDATPALRGLAHAANATDSLTPHHGPRADGCWLFPPQVRGSG